MELIAINTCLVDGKAVPPGQTFSADDAAATRFVRLGAAQIYVAPEPEDPSEDPPKTAKGSKAKGAKPEDPE